MGMKDNAPAIVASHSRAEAGIKGVAIMVRQVVAGERTREAWGTFSGSGDDGRSLEERAAIVGDEAEYLYLRLHGEPAGPGTRRRELAPELLAMLVELRALVEPLNADEEEALHRADALIGRVRGKEPDPA